MTHSQLLRGNNCPDYNAGNFQEYHYEMEWLECEWKIVHGTWNLVTAFWYPWIRVNYD